MKLNQRTLEFFIVLQICISEAGKTITINIDLTDTTEQRSKLAQLRPNLAAALLDFSWRVRKYWIVNTIFGICVALINMGILAWLQIPLVLTWGILAFVTAYIPNVGFIIGMVPPALMALLARDFQTMVIMVGLYVVVNFIASMVIQPKVTGDAVGLNITTTFISLVFWSIIIGPLGPILAVPGIADALRATCGPSTPTRPRRSRSSSRTRCASRTATAGSSSARGTCLVQPARRRVPHSPTPFLTCAWTTRHVPANGSRLPCTLGERPRLRSRRPSPPASGTPTGTSSWLTCSTTL